MDIFKLTVLISAINVKKCHRLISQFYLPKRQEQHVLFGSFVLSLTLLKINSSEGSGLSVHFQSNFGCCENLGLCTEKHCKNDSDNKNIECVFLKLQDLSCPICCLSAKTHSQVSEATSILWLFFPSFPSNPAVRNGRMNSYIWNVSNISPLCHISLIFFLPGLKLINWCVCVCARARFQVCGLTYQSQKTAFSSQFSPSTLLRQDLSSF